jgi:hypothetical protein
MLPHVSCTPGQTMASRRDVLFLGISCARLDILLAVRRPSARVTAIQVDSGGTLVRPHLAAGRARRVILTALAIHSRNRLCQSCRVQLGHACTTPDHARSGDRASSSFHAALAVAPIALSAARSSSCRRVRPVRAVRSELPTSRSSPWTMRSRCPKLTLLTVVGGGSTEVGSGLPSGSQSGME